MDSKNLTPIFFALLDSHGVPRPECEYKFLKDRRFRMDYAWIEDKVFLEVEGGVWVGGHTRPSVFVKNLEKYNLAAMNGWRLLRVEPKQLLTNATILMIKAALQAGR